MSRPGMEGACDQHLTSLLSVLGFRDPEEKCIYSWVSMARVRILDTLGTERARLYLESQKGRLLW